jgi:group I intron endonuclease
MTNGKIYVGCSVDIRQRLFKHIKELFAHKHHSQKLQRAWDKYGASVFTAEILELVENHHDLLAREQMILDRDRPYDSDKGYNICHQARNRLGVKSSPETCAKIGAAHKGKKLSREQIEQMRQANLGKKHTQETKRKIAEASRGRKASPETCAKIGQAHRGKKLSPAQKEFLHNLHQGNQYWVGKRHAEETKRKISLLARERQTEETRERARQLMHARWEADDGSLRDKIASAVSKRHKGKVLSEETRAKIREALKAAWARRKMQSTGSSALRSE